MPTLPTCTTFPRVGSSITMSRTRTLLTTGIGARTRSSSIHHALRTGKLIGGTCRFGLRPELLDQRHGEGRFGKGRGVTLWFPVVVSTHGVIFEVFWLRNT